MPDGLIDLALAILATWRIASALYYEHGPGDVFLRLRNWAGLHSPFWYEQLSCFWCCTMWAALVVLPFYLWWTLPLVPLALSGAAVLLSYGGRVIWREMADG